MLPPWFLYGKYYQFLLTSCGNVRCEEGNEGKKKHENISAATAQVDAQMIIPPELYPVASQNALLRRSDLSHGYADLLSSIMGTSYVAKETAIPGPIVRAAGVLNENSSTEVIDVDRLSQKSTSIIRYVCIAKLSAYIHKSSRLIR